MALLPITSGSSSGSSRPDYSRATTPRLRQVLPSLLTLYVDVRPAVSLLVRFVTVWSAANRTANIVVRTVLSYLHLACVRRRGTDDNNKICGSNSRLSSVEQVYTHLGQSGEDADDSHYTTDADDGEGLWGRVGGVRVRAGNTRRNGTGCFRPGLSTSNNRSSASARATFPTPRPGPQ